MIQKLASNVYIYDNTNKCRLLPEILNAIIRFFYIALYLYAVKGIKNKINACISIIDYINNDKKIIIDNVNALVLLNIIYNILVDPNEHFYAKYIII